MIIDLLIIGHARQESVGGSFRSESESESDRKKSETKIGLNQTKPAAINHRITNRRHLASTWTTWPGCRGRVVCSGTAGLAATIDISWLLWI